MPYLLILIIPLLIYAVLSAAIVFHLKRYGIAGDLTQKIINLFIAVSVILIIFTAWNFFSIPWDRLNLGDMIQSLINNNSTFYRQ